MRNLKSILSVCLTTLSFIYGTIGVCASDGPRFDMDINGNAAAAWLNFPTNGVVVQAAYKVGSSWSTPMPISAVNFISIDFPIVKVIANGGDISAVVLWVENTGTVSALFAAMLPNSTAGWTNPTQISTNFENVVAPQFHLRLTPSGDAVAVWASTDINNNEFVRFSTSTVGGTNAWTTPDYVSGP